MFAGLAILPVAVWTVITALYNNFNCWAVDTTNYGYIIDGPRIFTLVVSPYLMV
jgi:7 transmembrane receptor (Secretin family).